MSKSTRIIAVLALCMVFARVTSSAFESATYLPNVPSQTVTLEPFARLAIPFHILPGVEPVAIQGSGGNWYIPVFRVDSDDLNGAWILIWSQGTEIAAIRGSGGVNLSSFVEPIPDGPITPARGALVCGNDHRIYHFSWDTAAGERTPELVVTRLVGDTCS